MSTKLANVNTKLSTRNKKIKELLDSSSISTLELSADDVVKFAMFFIAVVFMMHVFSSLIPSLPPNMLISAASCLFAMALSVFVFKVL